MSAKAPIRILSLQGIRRFERLLDPRTVACGILGLAFVTALVGLLDPHSTSARTILPGLVDEARTALAKPPVPPPMLYKKLSPEQAAAFNAALPFTAEPNSPAKPFRLNPRSADYERSLDCLTAAVYYEASGEGPVGEAAVAQVVLNRVRHPAFPASVCAVVYQGSTRPTGCQFTFTCDGSLLREPNAQGWKAARAVAAAALSGSVFAGAGLATHYHADFVVPYWASSLAKNAQVGAHIFYRWPGTWGRPAAFRQRYGGEPWDLAQLRNAALVAHHRAPIDAGVRIALAIKEDHSRLEPLAVIKLLAGASSSSDEAKLVRASFKNEPPVVQAYREFQASHGKVDVETSRDPLAPLPVESKDPAADQLAAWVNDFANSSAYAAFAKGAGRSAAERAHLANALLPLVRDVQAYSGVPIGKVSVTLAPEVGGSSPQCAAGQDALGARLAQAAADYMIWASRAQSGSDAPALAGCSSSVDQQVVAAILIRMTALRSGEAAAQGRVAWEASNGHNLVPLLAERLRAFEANRDRFVTLASAYGALVGGLPALPLQRPVTVVAQGNGSTGQPGGPGAVPGAKTGS